jgi:phosphoribosylaminoimidazolecarboxamide formyltransferase/IMP cyclohydrolase
MSPAEALVARRALLATSDKRGLVAFARRLHGLGWSLVATSGSAELLRGAGIPVADVEVFAAAPPLLGGRLKTLTLPVFGGLLMRSGLAADEEDAIRWGFSPINMLVAGFYPLDDDRTPEADWIERIDVGGPAMLRAAAKNHRFVIPLVGPDDHELVLGALAAAAGDPAGVSLATRHRLAANAFRHASRYDQLVADAFARRYALDREGRPLP